MRPVYREDPTDGNPFSPEAYAPLQMLGKGGFSRVYLVRKKDDGKIYAMKVISKKFASKWGGELVKREFQLMKEVSHPLIVDLEYVFPTDTTYNFVIEFCPGGTLYENLRRKKKFSSRRALIYFAEMLCVMRYLHLHNILFRDLKAENVLLDFYGHIKLTDFGLARRFNLSKARDIYSFCGSPIYIAPETLARKAYDHKVDYYAMGILLYEMLTGMPPFNFKKADLIKKAKLTKEVEYPSSMDPRIVELLQCCLHKNPDKRVIDYNFYTEKLARLGVDMNLIETDRYVYKLDMKFDFKKERKEMDEMLEYSYFASNQEIDRKMRKLDEMFFFERKRAKSDNLKSNRVSDIKSREVYSGRRGKSDNEIGGFLDTDGDAEMQPEEEYQTNEGEEVTNLGFITMQSIQKLNKHKRLDLGDRTLKNPTSVSGSHKKPRKDSNIKMTIFD